MDILHKCQQNLFPHHHIPCVWTQTDAVLSQNGIRKVMKSNKNTGGWEYWICKSEKKNVGA